MSEQEAVEMFWEEYAPLVPFSEEYEVSRINKKPEQGYELHFVRHINEDLGDSIVLTTNMAGEVLSCYLKYCQLIEVPAKVKTFFQKEVEKYIQEQVRFDYDRYETEVRYKGLGDGSIVADYAIILYRTSEEGEESSFGIAETFLYESNSIFNLF